MAGLGGQRSVMPITLREATPADVPLIGAFIRELAEYERAPHLAQATDAQLHCALFGEPRRDDPASGIAECLIGEIDGVAQGLALYFHHFSTWTGRAGLYLEDLFVRPPARGKGLGAALFNALARIAVDRGCARMEWSVIDWNEPAIGFYKSKGAIAQDQWTIWRLSGEALSAVARQGR